MMLRRVAVFNAPFGGGFAVRWASKKAVGSTKNGRDSAPQYLGVKKFGGEYCKPGNVLVRQRGTRYHPGDNVHCGKDHTLHALVYGHVRFAFGVRRKDKLYVHVDEVDVDRAVLQELSPKSHFPPKLITAAPVAPKAYYRKLAPTPAPKKPVLTTPLPPAPKKPVTAHKQ